MPTEILSPQQALDRIVQYLRDAGVDVTVSLAGNVLVYGTVVAAVQRGRAWSSRPPCVAIEVGAWGPFRTQAYRTNVPGWEAKVLARVRLAVASRRRP